MKIKSYPHVKQCTTLHLGFILKVLIHQHICERGGKDGQPEEELEEGPSCPCAETLLVIGSQTLQSRTKLLTEPQGADSYGPMTLVAQSRFI